MCLQNTKCLANFKSSIKIKFAIWNVKIRTSLIVSLSLLLSTLGCLFVNSWVSLWILLEINTLSFCSLNFTFPSRESKVNKEIIIKYLVIQSIASAVIISLAMEKGGNALPSQTIPLLLVLALALKLASAPLHQWFIELLKKLRWKPGYILITWQKFAPLYVLIFQIKTVFPFLVSISCLAGSLFIINKTKMKEIIALSSVFNLGWILVGALVGLKILLIFSIIYWLSLSFFIKIVINSNKKRISECLQEQKGKSFLLITLVNLAGLPPLMGFVIKWATFSEILLLTIKMLVTLLLVLSTVNLFAYLRIISAPVIKKSTAPLKEFTKPTTKNFVTFAVTNLITISILFIYRKCLNK